MEFWPLLLQQRIKLVLNKKGTGKHRVLERTCIRCSSLRQLFVFQLLSVFITDFENGLILI